MKDTCIKCKKVVSITDGNYNQVKVVKIDSLEELDATEGDQTFSNLLYTSFKKISKTICLCDKCFETL